MWHHIYCCWCWALLFASCGQQHAGWCANTNSAWRIIVDSSQYSLKTPEIKIWSLFSNVIKTHQCLQLWHHIYCYWLLLDCFLLLVGLILMGRFTNSSWQPILAISWHPFYQYTCWSQNLISAAAVISFLMFLLGYFVCFLGVHCMMIWCDNSSTSWQPILCHVMTLILILVLAHLISIQFNSYLPATEIASPLWETQSKIWWEIMDYWIMVGPVGGGVTTYC